MEIDLEEFLPDDADKSNSYRYLLHGFVYVFINYCIINYLNFSILQIYFYYYRVLVHSGDMNEGHYFALLKPEENGKWFI
jgi:ubiquitin carboxyl-terminal hydrolase 7